MDYILGLLTATVFFLCLLFFFYLGIRYERKKPLDKVRVNETDEDVRKQNKIQDDFIKTMKYDVQQATARKKVT